MAEIYGVTLPDSSPLALVATAVREHVEGEVDALGDQLDTLQRQWAALQPLVQADVLHQEVDRLQAEAAALTARCAELATQEAALQARCSETQAHWERGTAVWGQAAADQAQRIDERSTLARQLEEATAAAKAALDETLGRRDAVACEVQEATAQLAALRATAREKAAEQAEFQARLQAETRVSLPVCGPGVGTASAIRAARRRAQLRYEQQLTRRAAAREQARILPAAEHPSLTTMVERLDFAHQRDPALRDRSALLEHANPKWRVTIFVATVATIAQEYGVLPRWLAFGEALPGNDPAGMSARLRQLRAKRGIGQRGMVAATGLSTGMISMLESGKTTPSLTTVEKLAASLGCMPGWLAFGGDDAPIAAAEPAAAESV